MNGYSGFSPPTYSQLLHRMESFPDDDTMAELRDRGVDYVIVHGAFYTPDEYRDLVTRIDERQDLHLEEATNWELRETRLYRVVK